MTPRQIAQTILDANQALTQAGEAAVTVNALLTKLCKMTIVDSAATPEEVEDARINYVAAVEAYCDLRIKAWSLARKVRR